MPNDGPVRGVVPADQARSLSLGKNAMCSELIKRQQRSLPMFASVSVLYLTSAKLPSLPFPVAAALQRSRKLGAHFTLYQDHTSLGGAAAALPRAARRWSWKKGVVFEACHVQAAQLIFGCGRRRGRRAAIMLPIQ